jgi:hypothetical protein
MWLPFASRRRPANNSRTALRRKLASAWVAVEALEDRTVPSFLAPVNYPAGSSPLALVAGDFNNDSLVDLAVANSSSSTVSVLLGNGDGAFQPPVTSASGISPRALALGDFNADGNLDIATANIGDVSVLLGNGNGSFQTPTSIDVSSEPVSIAAADFSADGKLDLLVTANSYDWGATANIFGGKGDGTFSAPTSTWLGYGHNGSAVADFNGDGTPDFAATRLDYWYDYLVAVWLEVSLNDGSGNLVRSFEDFADYDARSVAAGDVNGDGDTDLVTGNYGSVSVLLGDGLGAFGIAQNYPSGDYSDSPAIVLADFNNDSNADIAVNGATVLLGRGDGTFSPPLNSGAGSVAGDFNRDGWLDAATANRFGNNVSVLINDHIWLPPDRPSVSVSDVTVTEGHTGTLNATFTVSLSVTYGAPVTVHYSTADSTATAGGDYQAQSGTLTFAPGETTQTITVPINGDGFGEPDETFFVNLSTAEAFLIDGLGIGTILDDEPRVTISDATVTEGNTGTLNATFTVSLAAYPAPVTVQYGTANGTATAGNDYRPESGTLTFAAGETAKTVTVLINSDRLGEPDETFSVNLSTADAFLTDGQGIGTILDDEPRIRISDVTKVEGKKGQMTLFTFTVTLSAAYDEPVTMSYSTANGTAKGEDYVPQAGTLTFAPGETTKIITIEVKGDSKKEANETFYLDLFGLSSNALFTKNRGIGTILNDD